MRRTKLLGSGLTQTRLKELLAYDHDTGLFTWKYSFGNAKRGRVAGNKGCHGYRYIGVDAGFYRAHHLAWLYCTGETPASEVDHINGDRDDNRLCNLRLSTRAENMQNKARYRSNSSGYQGVHFHGASGKWASAIQCGGTRKHLGLFTSPEDAHAAYVEAKRTLHTFSPELRSK